MAKKHIHHPNQGQLGLEEEPTPLIQAVGRKVLFDILSVPEGDGEPSPEKNRTDLSICHATILHAEHCGVERSLSLLIISRKKLYTLWGYNSWAGFVKDRYGIGRAHAHRLTKHAELCLHLSGCGIRVLPTEALARKLLSLKTTIEVVRKIWQMVACGVEDVSPEMLDRAIKTFFPPKEENQASVQKKPGASSVIFVPSAELEPVLLKLAGEQNLTPQALIEKLIREEFLRRESEQVPQKVESGVCHAEKGIDQTTSPDPLRVSHSQMNVGMTTAFSQKSESALPRVRQSKAQGSRPKAPKKSVSLKMFESLKKKMS